MRDIKFRAFLNSKYYENPRMLSWEELLEQHNAIDMFRRDLMTLMQFTELKDKNGREIYEGDVVRVQETMDNGRIVCLEAVSTVVWNGQLGCWCCHGEFDGNLADYAAGTMLNAMGNICEVIGNIYEKNDCEE